MLWMLNSMLIIISSYSSEYFYWVEYYTFTVQFNEDGIGVVMV